MNKLYFRFWHKEEKLMFFPSIMDFNDDEGIFENVEGYTWQWKPDQKGNPYQRPTYFYSKADEVILMQGMEIKGQVVFIGDIILRDTLHDEQVQETISDMAYLLCVESLINMYSLDFKVIGNIYENEELAE